MATVSRRLFLQLLTFGSTTSVLLAACGDSAPLSTSPLVPQSIVRGLGSFAVLALVGGSSDDPGALRSAGDGISRVVAQGLDPARTYFYRFVASEPGTFPQGVFCGDPTREGAILSTRFVPAAARSGEIPLSLEIAATDSFPAASGTASAVGQFRTLGGSSTKFIHISCANDNPYPIGDALRNEVSAGDVDFVVFNGDTVYADRYWLGQEPTSTLEFYRSLYRDQRDPAYAGQGFVDLYTSVAFIANWDDHEVINDYSGRGNVGSAVQVFLDGSSQRVVDAGELQRLGYKAFFDYTPVTPPELLDPVSGVNPASRIFRRTQAGSSADIFTLDLRQYRDPEAVGPLVPILPPGLTAEVLAAQLQLTPAVATAFFGPPGFQSNLRDTPRTLMGRSQMEWLKAGLLSSSTPFKFIVSEFIFSEYYVLPYDRWEGYWQELQELLQFIRDNNIRGVVFLTGDAHSGWINQVNRGPDVWEIVTGPTGSGTLARDITASGQDVQQFYGVVNSFLAPAAAGGVPGVSSESLRFLEINTPNYMVIEASGGQARIQIKGAGGSVLTDPLGRRGEIVIS